MKNKKMAIVLIILILWALLSAAYIIWDQWQEFQVKKVQAAFDQGASQGLRQAILGIAQAAQNCQEVPLNLGQDKDGKAVVLTIMDVSCRNGAKIAPEAVTEEKK